jgi:hypothetical protein
MATNSITARQANDVREGYFEGFSNASHALSAEGRFPSVEFALGYEAGHADGHAVPRMTQAQREESIARAVASITAVQS